MPRIYDILPAILAQPSRAIDQALSAALKHADHKELATLSTAMMDRGRSNGLESLIAEYHRLPEDLQNRLVSEAEHYATSIRRAADRKGPVAAINALTIIRKAASTRQAYLVTALCRHAEEPVREQAGNCIAALAARAASSQAEQDQPYLDAVSTAYLHEAVEQAVVLYSRHDQPAVLQAMLWLLPRPMHEAFAALHQPEHAAAQALSDLLKNQPGIAGRRGLFALVGVRALSEACRDALAEACTRHQLTEPLELGHLLALPRAKRNLRRTRLPEMLWPDAKHQRLLPPRSSRWLPAYIDAITGDPQEQVVRLAPLARHSETATRLAVMRRLLKLAKATAPEDQPAADNANDTLALLTRDPEPGIARTALWHLIHTEYAGLPRILADLINSRHETIRKIASKRLAPMGFDRFWNAWPKLDPKRRLAAGRALIKIDEDFHRHLAGRLASRDPDKRLRALVIIATLNQGCFFEELLLDLCTSSDPRIVASAVKALSGCASEAAQQALQLAMEHDDTRIRANAVEALSHAQAAANLDRLMDMAGDQAQRPRANAIKALLELRAKDAMPSLTRMLSDQRAQHRSSALWLIDELGILQLARLVAEISLTDEDEKVKKQAGKVIQHLIHDLENQADTPLTPRSDQPTEAA